jgi:nucleotide-binding universal stress UspA family protein
MSAYQSILAVTFGTELSDRAVREAARIARAMSARLLLLHVRSPMDVPDHTTGGALTRLGEEKISEEINAAERRLLDSALRIAAAEGVQAETAFVTDISTHQAVVRVATERRCDLIVMATRIRHGIPGYFAKSETQKVLENSTIPVLVVR